MCLHSHCFQRLLRWKKLLNIVRFVAANERHQHCAEEAETQMFECDCLEAHRPQTISEKKDSNIRDVQCDLAIARDAAKNLCDDPTQSGPANKYGKKNNKLDADTLWFEQRTG